MSKVDEKAKQVEDILGELELAEAQIKWGKDKPKSTFSPIPNYWDTYLQLAIEKGLVEVKNENYRWLALSPEEFQKREEEFLSSLANSLLKEMSSEEIEQLIKKLMEDAIQQMTILSIFEEGGLEPVFLERIVRLLSLLKPLHFIGKTTY